MLEIFQYEFMQRAFLAGTIAAIIAPLIGMFLVVKGYSLMADTLAHVSLAGIAIGVLTSTQPIIAAMITAVLASIAIEALTHNKKVYGESALALFLTGSLAIATVLLRFGKNSTGSIVNFLFGSITTVTHFDVMTIIVAASLVIATILFFYKKFFFVAFDENAAKVTGLNAHRFNILLMILASITVSLTIRIIGVLLIGALMVIPVITALQFKQGFKRTHILAVAFSLFAVLSGLFASYSFDLPSGGTIVLIALLLLTGSLFIKK